MTGHLLTIIEHMVRQKGVDSVRISKVEGHADDDMVRLGKVRAVDVVGNDLADKAAGFGRRRVPDVVVDIRRRFVSARSFWYPVVLVYTGFFVAIARAVNEDGCSGVALHPVVWSEGGLPKRRKVRVSAWDHAWVPGPLGLWGHGSIGWPLLEVRDADVGFWPFSVNILVKLCSFLSSLHWPSSVVDFTDVGVGGVLLVEMLFYVCMNVGLERGLFWKLQCLSTVVLVVQFLCLLFLRDRALIFGNHSRSWVLCCGLQIHAVGVLTIAGFGLLVGSNVVMVSCLGLLKLLVLVFCNPLWLAHFG